MRKFLLVVLVVMLAVGGGCGIGIGMSSRAILRSQSAYDGVPFLIANRCSRGLWSAIFKDRSYLVLLQNNAELRATGGFMGSYARLEFENTGLTQLKVEDIYQPDGQLLGHVEPPYPIQEAFGQGWWKLRDSNWDPDFASASGTIRWFFEQGGEKDIDGIIAVNLDLFRQWLGVIGEIKTQTYDEIITESNLYSLAQKYAETPSLSGSNNKRDFLATVGNSLIESTKQASVRSQLKLARLVYDNLQKKQILIASSVPELQQIVDRRKWNGKITSTADQDYLYVVEDNLGANKANPLVERNVLVASGTGQQTVRVEWENKNPFSTPKPPIFWGGDYFVYVRVVVPSTYIVNGIRVGELQLKRRDGVTEKLPASVLSGRSEDLYDVVMRGELQMIGFWSHIPAGKSIAAEIELQRSKGYSSMLVRRQPGIGQFDYTHTVEGKIVSHQDVDRDTVFEW